jgi:hypothetical protein
LIHTEKNDVTQADVKKPTAAPVSKYNHVDNSPETALHGFASQDLINISQKEIYHIFAN